jgi:predicted acylesterase/phospholipase RssA
VKSNAFVLSGGGARVFVHLGVYKALIEAGYTIDIVAGSSGGAFIAALIAKELSVDEISKIFINHLSNSKSAFDYTLPKVSLLKANKIAVIMKQIFGEETLVENLWKRFFCTSANLTTSSCDMHTQGVLWKRLRASAALPSIFPPVSINNEVHVDGGIINNIPVDLMKNFAPKSKIISSSLTLGESISCNYLDEGIYSGWSSLFKRNKTTTSNSIPNIASIIGLSIGLSSTIHQQNMSKVSDLNFVCDASFCDLLDFSKIQLLIDKGYQTAISQLESKG